HGVENAAVGLESTERAPELGVDTELTEEDTEADQPRHGREARFRGADVDRPRIGTANASASRRGWCWLASADAPSHLRGARRALALGHSKRNGCARRALSS